MKKTNNVKVNKVNENAKVNNTKATKANNETKANKTNVANTKIDAKQLTTVQIADDVSVTLEAKTLSEMESWAMHTYRDLSEDSIYVGMAYEDGKTDIIGYTEDELNQMIANAGLIVNLFDSNDDNRYCVTGANVYESCMRIIDICKAYIHALHGNYDAIGLVKPKYKSSTLPINIESEYHRLYTEFVNTHGRDMFAISYTRDELYSISGKATRILNDLGKYDCSDVCNVEVTKYFCTEVINIVNDLLETIDDSVSCTADKTNTSIGYEEYDDF